MIVNINNYCNSKLKIFKFHCVFNKYLFLSVRIQTDHNEDDTLQVLQTWKENIHKLYHKIELRHQEEPKSYSDAKGPNQWTSTRYLNLLKLKQNAFDEARKDGSDYIFVSFFFFFYFEKITYQTSHL